MERIEGLSIGLNLDTLKVDSGLNDLRSSLRQVNSEMKANLSAFDRGDQSLEKYQATVDGLNKKIQVQQKIVDKARVSYEKMVAEHGEGSVEAQKAATQYNNQSASLQNMERSLGRAQKGLTDLQEEQRIASSGWTKVSDAADKSAGRIEKIGDGLKNIGGRMSLAITAPLTGAFATLTRGTDEFRGDMAVLETNAREAGVGVDTIRTSMERLSAISTETDSNVEALSNLLALNFSDSGMTKTLDALSGAVLKFPDTLKIEGVADGLQETLATGAAIGPFGELLERMGVNLDTFNDGLTNAIKNGDEENYILQQLADLGLADVNESFRKNNDELVKSREESQKFQQATADLGAALTPIMTRITTGLTTATNWFNNLSAEGKNTAIIIAALAAALGPLVTAFGFFAMGLKTVISVFGSFTKYIANVGGLLKFLRLGFAALTGPIGITIAVIAALAAGFVIAYKKSETFRNIVHAVRDAIVSAYQKVKEFLTTNPQFLAFLDSVRNGFAKAKDMIMQAFGVAMDFVREKISQIKAFWDSDGQQLLQAFRNIFSGISAVVTPVINGLVAAFQWALPYMKTIFSTTFSILLSIAKSIWSNIKGVIDGGLKIITGLIQVFSGIFTGDFSKMWQGVKNIFSGAIQFVWNLIQLMFYGKILKAGMTFIKSFAGVFSSMWSGIRSTFSTVIKFLVDFVKNRFTSMKNTTTGIFNGLRGMTDKIFTAIKNGIINPIKNAYTATTQRIGSLRDRGVQIFRDMRDKVKGTFDDMVTGIKNLPVRMKDGLINNAKKLASGAKEVSKYLLEGLAKGINGVGDGINWILDKVKAPKKLRIPEWSIPAYAKGTDGHPGGPALVSDAKGRNKQELIRTPDGNMFLSPKKETLMNLPKGTSVLDGNSTANLLKSGIPAYKDGEGLLQKAWGGAKSLWGSVKKTATTIWDFAKDPLSLIKTAVSDFTNLGDVLQPAKGIAEGMISKATSGAKEWIKGLLEGGDDVKASGNPTADVKKWVTRAMEIAGVSGSNWLNGLSLIAMRESGGNPKAQNNWDINAIRGIPSKGLMQTIGPTFNAFKKKGYDNILNPVHNILAAIGYIKTRYKTIGNVPGVKAVNQGRPYVGYATGGRVANNGLYQLAEEGYPEWIIPTDPSRRTEAMKLLALAGKEIAGNKRPNQLPNPTGGSHNVAVDNTAEMLAVLKQILQLLLNTDFSVNIDGEPLIRKVFKYIDAIATSNVQSAERGRA